MDKYLVFIRELKEFRNMKAALIPLGLNGVRTSPMYVEKSLGELDIIDTTEKMHTIGQLKSARSVDFQFVTSKAGVYKRCKDVLRMYIIE